MKRVTGIGGVFISANDPVKLRAWYRTHPGIDVQEVMGPEGNKVELWQPAEGR